MAYGQTKWREREERRAVFATRIVKMNFSNYAFIISSQEETLVLG